MNRGAKLGVNREDRIGGGHEDSKERGGGLKIGIESPGVMIGDQLYGRSWESLTYNKH